MAKGMKAFQVELKDITKIDGGYRVIGRCIGDSPIVLGDFLNDLEVVKIEAYSKELDELSPGMVAGLTLSYQFREAFGDGSDWLLLTLSEYKFERKRKPKTSQS
jgi:hypothetical protein